MALKGSKTEGNLKAAFAGESQANRRYLYFAQKADVEGYPDTAALFRSVAEGETGHAHGHLEYIAEVGVESRLSDGELTLDLAGELGFEQGALTIVAARWVQTLLMQRTAPCSSRVRSSGSSTVPGKNRNGQAPVAPAAPTSGPVRAKWLTSCHERANKRSPSHAWAASDR